MTQQTHQHPGEAHHQEPQDFPGRRLREQRQARGLDIERIASQLHLRRELVEAIEEDDYTKLPDPVFTAGYMRNYARLLNIDPTPVIAAYRAHQVEPEPSIQPVHVPRPGGGASRWLARLVSLALFAAALGMLALWWQNRAPGLLPEAPLASLPASPEPIPTPPSSSAAMDAAPPLAPAADAPLEQTLPPLAPLVAAPEDRTSPPQLAAPEPVAPATPDPRSPEEAVPASDGPPPEPEPEVIDRAETPVTEPLEEDTPETPRLAATATPEVVLSFTGNCWVEVRDAERRILFTGEFRAGDQRRIEGAAPYRLIIGNTALARLSIDGEPYDLGAHARGNVARFTLDPSAID
ncbi:MAG: helix-turn-helix domain-containing protein [Chromatiaceae bacterium]|nr:helix-turn-helix domain-containing protein [Chromatiaceae bacterium]